MRSTLDLRALVGGLAREDRANLAVTLGLEPNSAAEKICEEVRWMYHSKVRSEIRKGAKPVVDLLKSRLRGVPGVESKAATENDDYPVPTWADLVDHVGRHLKAFDETADLTTNERYICQAVIVRALAKMTPPQRDAFFSEKVDWGELLEHGGPKGSNAGGAFRGVQALAFAEAAGFSLYTASSTALSMVSGGLGITLPFAAYTGLSSILSFVTGPVGWIAAIGFLGWKLTGPELQKLLPAVIYLINVRAREAALQA